MIDSQNSLLGFACSSAEWPGCPPAVQYIWLECTFIIVRPADLFCPMDVRMWLLMCLRPETLLSCCARPIGEVAPVSTGCLTLKKMSPSRADNIARRSSGSGVVFLGWEVLTYTPMVAGTSNFVISIAEWQPEIFMVGVLPHLRPMCAFVLFAPRYLELSQQPLSQCHPSYCMCKLIIWQQPGWWPALWMGGGLYLSESGLFSDIMMQLSTEDAPKVLDHWRGGVQGHVPLGKFCHHGPYAGEHFPCIL